MIGSEGALLRDLSQGLYLFPAGLGEAGPVTCRQKQWQWITTSAGCTCLAHTDGWPVQVWFW
jgi:hypothetical protein